MSTGRRPGWYEAMQAAADTSCCWLTRTVGLTSSVSKRSGELQQLIAEDLPCQICLQSGQTFSGKALRTLLSIGERATVPHSQRHLQGGSLLLSLMGQLQLTPSRQPRLLMWHTCHAVLAPAAVQWCAELIHALHAIDSQ